MNQAYQIPKRGVRTVVILAGVSALPLRLFLSECASSHSGNERPSDLLNGIDPFIPATDQEDRILFLRSEAILQVSVDADAEFGGEAMRAEDLAPEQATQATVSILMDNGDQVTGTLSYLMPEGSRRLQDVLNTQARFLVLRDGDQARLVNKNHVVRVTPA